MITSIMRSIRHSLVIFVCLLAATSLAAEEDRVRVFRQAEEAQAYLDVNEYYLVHYLTRDLFVIPQFTLGEHMDFDAMAFFASTLRDYLAPGSSISLQVDVDDLGTLSFQFDVDDEARLWMVSNYLPRSGGLMTGPEDAASSYGRVYGITDRVMTRFPEESRRREANLARADAYLYDTDRSNDGVIPILLEGVLAESDNPLDRFIAELTGAQYAMTRRDLLEATNAVSRAGGLLAAEAALAPYEPLLILVTMELEILRSLLFQDLRRDQASAD